MLTTAMIIYGSIGIFRRYIPYSSALLCCVRGIVGSLCIIIYVKLKRGRVFCDISKRDLLLLAMNGAIIGGNWIFLFESYKYTTVAISTLCYYMQPTIVILMSPIVFKDKLSKKKILCVIVSFIGMFLVAGMNPNHILTSSDVRGIILGLIAAALYATVVFVNKKITVEDVYTRTIIQLITAAIAIMPYWLITETFRLIELSTVSLIMVLIVGVVHTGIAYVLYFGSITKLNPQSAAFLSYLDPISALVLAAIILKEAMSFYSILGAMLIIGSAILSEIPSKSTKSS